MEPGRVRVRARRREGSGAAAHASTNCSHWARRHPGRFTYPAPPDFTGSAFVRQVVMVKGEDAAFAYLRRLKPLMYRERPSAAQDRGRAERAVRRRAGGLRDVLRRELRARRRAPRPVRPARRVRSCSRAARSRTSPSWSFPPTRARGGGAGRRQPAPEPGAAGRQGRPGDPRPSDGPRPRAPEQQAARDRCERATRSPYVLLRRTAGTREELPAAEVPRSSGAGSRRCCGGERRACPDGGGARARARSWSPGLFGGALAGAVRTSLVPLGGGVTLDSWRALFGDPAFVDAAAVLPAYRD